ncbi:hypothetical protein [Nonlabens sp. Asnod3-A02]|uniref:hypothetical protein n=1 Tax=Nonlabens sp. Asnod3-A02 TaxID=3160579 RepID=UPI00386B5635
MKYLKYLALLVLLLHGCADSMPEDFQLFEISPSQSLTQELDATRSALLSTKD